MKKIMYILFILLMSMSVVACSTDNSKDVAPEEVSKESITIEHSAGTTVLDKPAERVVALEWIYGEDMLALGVQPVGMTDIEGYTTWMNSGDIKLDENVADLGVRGSANLEDIAALKPDLIVTADYYEYDYELLSAIAPTIVLTPYPGEGHPTGEYDHMISSIELMGKVLGLDDKAAEVIDNLEKAYAEANEILKDTDVDFDYIELIDFSTADTVSMYLYTDSSIHTTILEKIGFNNIYKPEKFELYGQTNINVENLVGLDKNTLFVVADEGADIFSKNLISENVLNGLDFYTNDKMYYLGANASPFGPLSTLTFVDTVVESVLSNE
ncbi:iron-siderophore ABC transporter substrate-binding protein [Tissierella sp. Yu-01]|uniref:ABC transporter substrate-binding protein n=1 Tax=Tissierella sp. Yu-01 TaxID=3035694 RepID=UPI00240D973C|nr:iron-siderophore ABC transporter substrate-binding protein [Tissierella sp. Yu-01]WFA10079.1 iron-siderophore ABC transporter substrate-binding protein [Tissierella sp. Yu-01]